MSCNCMWESRQLPLPDEYSFDGFINTVVLRIFRGCPTLTAAVHQKPVVIDSDKKTTDFVVTVALFIRRFCYFADHFFVRNIYFLNTGFTRNSSTIPGSHLLSLWMMLWMSLNFIHSSQFFSKGRNIGQRSYSRLQLMIILNTNYLIIEMLSIILWLFSIHWKIDVRIEYLSN